MADDEKAPVKFGDKPLTEMTLWELGELEKAMNVTLAKREEASKHPKFGMMNFPPPNPLFLEMKNAVELEIKKRQEQSDA